MSIQRKIILRELKKLNSHPTAEEVYFLVRKIIPNIGLGTVYRNLNFLADKGLVQKIESAGSQKKFDGNTEDHHHFRCEECGKVYDLLISGISAEEVCDATDGHIVTGCNFNFYGICKSCKGGRNDKIK